jgi:LacI family transcriptional regulator
MASVNVRQVAKNLSLSPATVSKAVRGQRGEVSVDTTQKVLSYCTKNGYMTRAEANNIMFKLKSRSSSKQLFTVTCRRGVEVYDATFSGICQELQDNGLFSSFYVVSDKNAMNKFPYDQAGVAILLGRVSDEVLEHFLEKKIPVVLVDNRIAGSQVSAVNSNNLEGVVDSVGYLARLGHKRIAFACMHEDEPNVTYTFHQRQAGYIAGLACAGIPFDPELLVIDYSEDYHSEYFDHQRTVNDLKKLAYKILELKELPTAIVAVNDETAYVIRDVLEENGIKVPQDVSIIGYDGAHVLNPFNGYAPVSTRVVDWYKMGKEAVALALDLYASEETAAKCIEITTTFEDMGTLSFPKQ